MDPVAALDRIAFLLERDGAPTYRVRAFRGASAAVAAMPPEELRRRAERAGGLEEVKGLGPKTAAVVREALAGERPAYLTRLAEGAADAVPRPEGGAGLRMRAALRGDCHLHSDWSDGGSPIETMARTAMELGHEWAALTDHSPRLTVARGLTAERLRAQLGVVAEVGERLPPSFRLLTGIECDILADGALDQNAELLDRLDVVVASVHSKLRMDRDEMTRRMISAISNPWWTCSATARAGWCRASSARSRSSTRTWSSPPASASGWPWRSTAAPTASTRRAGCCAGPWRPGCSSASTATPTPPASWTGRSTAARAPRSVESP